MLQPILNSTTIPLLEHVAKYGERRQEVLAGNIANIDTPEYRRRDLPAEKFQESLRQMIAARRTGGSVSNGAGSMNPASPHSLLTMSQMVQQINGNQTGIDASREVFQAVEVEPAQDATFQDGNNRSVEREMMTLTKNVMMQSFAIEVMSTQMNMLQTAIMGRL
jgi:flagellar basal-body rod protein FlgB